MKCGAYHLKDKKLINSLADEKANVNFFSNDIAHVLQNTIDSHKFSHRSTLFVATK